MIITSLPTLAAWSAGVFVVWYIVTAIASWYRLRHIPGPFFARFSYIWHLQKFAMNGHGGPLYENLHNIYADGGPFVTIAPGYVVTNDPDIWRDISAARSPYGRDQWWKAGQFHPEYKNLVCILDTEEHDRLKAKTASGYSGREVGSEFEPAIDDQIRALVGLIRRKYLSTADKLVPADISRLMRLFTLDVITRIGYGKSWGHLDNGEDVVGYVQGVDDAIKYVGVLLDTPFLRQIFFTRIGLRLFGPKQTDKAGLGRAQAVIHQIVSERFRPDNKRKLWNDMVGGFMRKGLTQEEIEGEGNLQILAGSDTTASALCSAIIHITTNPSSYLRFKCEVHTAIASGLVSPAAPITFEQALKLPYLQAVIWEAMRMRFPVNYGHYKSVPPGGDTLKGVFLPGGTAIGHNALALTRNEAVFGQDVHLFRPERFLEPEANAETKVIRIRAIDNLFGGGRWVCSGKQVAMFELNKTLFELMRQFDFQAADPKVPWTELHFGGPRFLNAFSRITEADWSSFD